MTDGISSSPRILVFSGSVRTGSVNEKLAALMAHELAQMSAEVTRISLRDYELPLYDGDLEAADGVPENAVKLAEQFRAHHGVFIACPEYNSSITPLLKNTIDWLSRVKFENAPPSAPFREDRVFAIGAATPGSLGGIRTMMTVRSILSNGLGALVIPQQTGIPAAGSAFTDEGRLENEGSAKRVREVAGALVSAARAMAPDLR